MARARVGAKSRLGTLLDAMSKNVADRRVSWRIIHGELAENEWRVMESFNHGE